MKYGRRIAIVMGVVFIAFMAVNFGEVDRVWTKWLKGKGQIYYGNINLWHINDDFSLKIPYATMLKKYEKQNFGVFINVSYMSAQEAKEKMQAGEHPDLVTYSHNLFSKPEKELEKLKKTDAFIMDTGALDKTIRAYPIYYDTYSLIINEELIDESEEELPTLIELDYIMNKLIKLPFKDGVIPMAFSSYGAAVNLAQAVGEAKYDIPYSEADLKEFEKGNIAVMVCSSLELEKYAGELPSHSTFQFSGFTDRIRFLSVYNGSGDENKIKCSKEIAELFIGEKIQKQISDYAFSLQFGYSGLKNEKDIMPTKVFYNTLDKETAIRDLSIDRKGLLKKIREIVK